MTRRVLVVGSGPSAVHFAQTVLEKGYEVTMIDLGRTGLSPEMPDKSFPDLKEQLDDPARFFLGEQFEGVHLPDTSGEFYDFPPGKQFALVQRQEHDGFMPLQSHGRGGLAELWTAGCYPFDDGDLHEFPFDLASIAPCYDEVARRIGVSGTDDDLTQFFPRHAHLLPPLRLDAASQSFLDAYNARRERVNRKYNAFVGHTRVATLSERMADRDACQYLGRCMWGCPRQALYTPSLTLAELERKREFRYLPGRRVERVTLGSDGAAEALVCRRVADGVEEQYPIERIALAAGTLGSAEILLRSLANNSSRAPKLTGLMDNRQVLVPFVQWRMLGQRRDESSYQYHLIGMGIPGATPAEYVHAQITTLTSALLHPVLQRLPFDLRTAIAIGRVASAALGLVNVNFSDHRRSSCRAWLEGDNLKVRYVPPDDEPRRLSETLKTVRRVLRELGCFVPPGMTHVRPMGASAHYAGLVPMTTTRTPLGASPQGQSWDVPNLYLVDGITFPSLPSKNLTFTLMANSVRIAREAF